ncbi:hypothetical protein F2Q70_00003857 [Brassica cretica]|uniref:Uncharacterized protein n=1 Tax=Brassica cretica TaxID=69181 RepID=A0A8S9J0P0_BRACR|nr:hypothetical protein F2Q70_00003857 [Brassica cretica]
MTPECVSSHPFGFPINQKAGGKMLDPILVNKLMGKHRSGMNGVGQAGGPLRAVEERSKA